MFNFFFKNLLKITTIFCASITLFICGYLFYEALKGLEDPGLSAIFFTQMWDPEAISEDGSFSIIPMIFGSICSSMLAITIAIPISLGCSSFLFLKNSKILHSIVELLAGIPSVVYGLWGLTTIVPIINMMNPPGASLLTGGIVLSIMICPIIILTSNSALRDLPEELKSSGIALGLDNYSLLRTVLIPAASQKIISGIILALARAFGETMAILMVCGNIAQIPKSLYDPILTLTSVIALEMGYAYGAHTQALYVAGFTLLLIVLFLIVLTRKIDIGKTYVQV